MITLVTGIIDRANPYLDIYFEWAKERTTLVTEVLMPKADAPDDYVEEWKVGNITFRKFGYQTGVRDYIKDLVAVSAEHALLLHKGIEKASNQLVWTCDPDIFYWPGVDEFYLSLMNKYNLDIIGMSSHHGVDCAYRFFPDGGNSLFKKSSLPDENWMKGKFKIGRNTYRRWGLQEPRTETELVMDGKFLLPGAIPEYTDMFPNPDGGFEMGCYLWLWANEHNWKWVSFQTPDCHMHFKCYNRSNVKLEEKFKREPLLYHATAGTTEDRFDEYKRSYEELTPDD